MKIFKTLFSTLLLAVAVMGTAYGKVNPVVVNYNETPAKTVCIKHPSAENINKYFSSTTMLHFEVYKAGSQEDLNKVVAAFTSDANVESCTIGTLTGDYQAFDVSLKSAKNKAWFVSKFKAAGLNNIKVNNNPIVEVDKL